MAPNAQAIMARKHLYSSQLHLVRRAVVTPLGWKGVRTLSSQSTAPKQAPALSEAAAVVNSAPAGVAVESEVLANRAPKDARGLLKCYSQLGKARLSSLVVASASAGFLLAGAPVDPVGLAAVSAGVALQSFSANSFNQVYEVKNDGLMNRTRARPLPARRITKAHATMFGVVNGVAGTALLAAYCNPVSAALGAANIALYAGVYTPMKQWTIWNTHVGAVVGALPPLIGYAAATGSLSIEAGILGAGLYWWQLSHFYALSWMYRGDYAAGGYKMLGCMDASGARTGAAIVRSSMALCTLPLASYSLGITGSMFPIESILFNGALLWASYKFKAEPTVANARRVFRGSLLYLPVFMALLIFHKNGWSQDDHEKLMNTLPRQMTSVAVSKEHPDSNSSSAPEGSIEGFLLSAKAKMRSVCIHEYLVKPPLTRVGKEPATSLSTESLQADLISTNPLCPVSQASRAFEDLGKPTVTNSERI